MIKLALLITAGIMAAALALTSLVAKTKAMYGRTFNDRMLINDLCIEGVSYIFVTVYNGGQTSALATTVVLGLDGKPVYCVPEE